MKDRQNFPEDKFAVVNGRKLHYLDWGNKARDKVLILHGLTSCAANWQIVARHLAPYRHVLVLDQRGHGDSEWGPGSYTTDDFVSDVDAFLEAQGIERAAIIGHSMGGRIGVVYAASHPEKVSRLIIVDTGLEIGEAGLKRVLDGLSVRKDEYDSLDEVFDYLRLGDPLARPELLRQEAENLTRKLAGGKLAWKHDRQLEARFLRTARDKSVDWWEVISHITCPTLILRGKQSEVLEYEAAVRMSNTIPRAELVEVDGSGHGINRDNPKKLNEEVFRFLGLSGEQV